MYMVCLPCFLTLQSNNYFYCLALNRIYRKPFKLTNRKVGGPLKLTNWKVGYPVKLTNRKVGGALKLTNRKVMYIL